MKLGQCEWFWAGEDGGFVAALANTQNVKKSENLGDYSFRIASEETIQPLRLAPLVNRGESRVESVSMLVVGTSASSSAALW